MSRQPGQGFHADTWIIDTKSLPYPGRQMQKHIHLISRAAAKARGLNRYFPASQCKHGHIAERYTQTGKCLDCVSIKSRSQQKKDYDSVYYEKNRDRIIEQARIYRAENSDSLVVKAKKWSADNPEKRRAISRAYKHRRRAIEKKGDSTADLMEWEAGAEKKCYWCGIKCLEKYHVDHYEPLSRGGTHTIDNLVIACQSCNLHKSAKDPYEFAATLGRLF